MSLINLVSQIDSIWDGGRTPGRVQQGNANENAVLRPSSDGWISSMFKVEGNDLPKKLRKEVEAIPGVNFDPCKMVADDIILMATCAVVLQKLLDMCTS